MKGTRSENTSDLRLHLQNDLPEPGNNNSSAKYPAAVLLFFESFASFFELPNIDFTFCKSFTQDVQCVVVS